MKLIWSKSQFQVLPLLYRGAAVILVVQCVFVTATGSKSDTQRGPTFPQEPASRVEFNNSTGTVVACTASGQPIPLINWVHQDGSPLRQVSGLRHVRPDGALVFPPFAAEDFRQDVHDAIYKCIASNVIGKISSRDVHVKAVVQRRYKVQVYDELVVHGNTAVLRCQVPNFVQEYISFVAWKRDDGVTITSTIMRGGRYSILSTGELYIRSVSQADSQKSYSCQTRHRLTGETVSSASAGRLFVTEPHGTSAPKIMDIRPLVSAKEGETLELACAAVAFPPPIYRWYKEENGELLSLNANHRITQLEGSLVLQYANVQDSGKYICLVNNSVGENRANTLVTISAALSARVSPQRQTADVGRAATFNCTITGHPLISVTWLKDLRPLDKDMQGSEHIVLLARDVLHIPVVQRHDKGMYQCFAHNDFEAAQGTAELELGDVAPVLLATFSGGAVQPSSSLSLRCSASGNPLPQIMWTLDDINIPDAVRFRVGDYVTSEGHVVSYVNVSDVRVEDGGSYSCTATNALSQATYSASVQVYGPPVVREMRNVTVIAGEKLTVRCPVSGHPIESILWSKDGVNLPMNHRQKIEPSGKLQIQDVQRASEEGLYTCKATGLEGKTAEGSLTIKVVVAPAIDPAPMQETQYVNEGQKIKIMCNVLQGDPPVHISWTKNGVPLLGEKDITLQNFDDSTILSFRNVHFHHHGNYTCVASNHASTVNRTTHLIVNVPPRWIVEPSNGFVVLGQRVAMDCMADGFPRPRIYWKKAKGSSASDFHDILSSYRRQVYDNGSFVIQEVEEKDGGHYLCQAANGIGGGLSKVIFLMIHTPPKFELKFVSHTVEKGKEANLKCNASGELPITIKWEKDKQRLDLQAPANRRITIQEDTGALSVISRLTVIDAVRPDSALYTCIATNQFGSDDSNIQLVVQEPPSSPVDVIIKEKTSRSVVLSWTPGFSGNFAVSKYTIQYENDTGNGPKNPQEVTIPGTENFGTVRGLLPASPFRFRIIATNSLGASEPSEFIKVITDEEVPGGPPLHVEVFPTGSQSLKVTWQAPRTELQHGSIQGYYIGYKIAGTNDQYQYKNVEATNSPQQQLSYLTNLRRMTSYKIIVQAYNNVGAGPRSDEVTSTTLEAAPPTSPLLVTKSVSSSSITVRWERHSDDTIIKDYVLHYKPDAGDWQREKLSTSRDEYTMEGLKCGTRYRLYMTASNSLGTGEPSDTVSARTRGAAPVSPQKESFLSVNSTFVSLDFIVWGSGGCPIHYYSVHLRTSGQWKVIKEKIEVNQRQTSFEVKHLVPNREYSLRVSAHSDAGTTEAEYRFITLNATLPPMLMKPQVPPLSLDNLISLPFYKNLAVLLPVIISIAVLLVVLITVVVCLRKQVDTNSSSGDSRKGRNSDTMGLTEFPAKNLKDPDSYGKSSYYSSPTRKPISVASSSHRISEQLIENNHEYAEPYTTVPEPRCIMDGSQGVDIISMRSKNDGMYSTVKRSPSRCGSNFRSSIDQGIEIRTGRRIVDRIDLCNNSSSSQSGASAERLSSQSSEGYRGFRQDVT